MVKKSWTFISKVLTNFPSVINVFLPTNKCRCFDDAHYNYRAVTESLYNTVSAYLYITLFPADCLILRHVLLSILFLMWNAEYQKSNHWCLFSSSNVCYTQMSKDIPHRRPEVDYHILPCMGFKMPPHIRYYPLNVINILSQLSAA